MYFLFSGEGSTDMGIGKLHDDICEGENYQPGPMAYLVDLIVAHEHNYSPIDSECVGYVTKTTLKNIKPQPGKARMIIRGCKRPPETALFYRNAQSLAKWAEKAHKERNEEVVAVLFRDCDNRVSSPRSEWQHKFDSIQAGFLAEGVSNGVPMLPKPKSEAWLICALKEEPYSNCKKLENLRASEKAKRQLKSELRDILENNASRKNLNKLVKDKRIDTGQINMPSFNAFRDRLLEVI